MTVFRAFSKEATMKTACSFVLITGTLLICLVGCGGGSTSTSLPPPPQSNECTGVVFTGILHDSLTGQPVSQGWAIFESGTQLSVTSLYTFSATQKVATDGKGEFRLCTSVVPNPSVLILEALDSAGMVYPPFIAPVIGAADLGTIPMGGCALLCGFEGSQQTTSPATISGVITSAPIAKTGSIAPHYPVAALDGSKSKDGSPNLWNLAMPIFDSSEASAFSTSPGACDGLAPNCATYTFRVPSQNPIWRVSGGTLQQLAGRPAYMIYAVPDGSSCVPPFGFTIF
jgi:hypothetical protein